jgi:hypothetical protein
MDSMVFPVREILINGLIAGAIAASALALWPWARRRARFLLAGITTTMGLWAWNFALNVTHVRGFNTDAPFYYFRISWQDGGSGVLAFTVTALVIGLIADRREPGWRVLVLALVAASAAIVWDIFVL